MMASTDRDRAFKEQIREEWTASAPPWQKWHAKVSQQFRAATEVLMEVAQVRPGMQVLDLASGTGDPALSLADAVAPTGHVVATDLVPAMLASLEENARAQGLTNLRTQQADMEALPFPDARFDVATCRFGLMYCPQAEQALREVYRVIKPGGRAALLVWGPPDQPMFASTSGVFMKYDTAGEVRNEAKSARNAITVPPFCCVRTLI